MLLKAFSLVFAQECGLATAVVFLAIIAVCQLQSMTSY